MIAPSSVVVFVVSEQNAANGHSVCLDCLMFTASQYIELLFYCVEACIRFIVEAN